MMTEAIFLDAYDGQSVDALISLESTHRIDSLVLAFEEAITNKRMSLGDGSLSDSERVVLAIEGLEREVNNGGFSQFFYNSSVEFAPIIVDCLNKIACPKTANIAQRAIDILELDELDPDSIDKRMDPDDEELEEKLGKLDDEFYEYVEDISKALFNYIKSHKDQINFS